MELQVGQKVQLLRDYPLVKAVDSDAVGAYTGDQKPTGTIVSLNTDVGKDVGIRMDNFQDSEGNDTLLFMGHECDGACEKGRGWYTKARNVVVITEDA